MGAALGDPLPTQRQTSLIERLIVLLAVTVLAAAVPFLWHHGPADERTWVLCAAVGGVMLLSRERHRGGTYRADVAVVLLLVQAGSLYLLARDHLGSSGTWFLVSLLLVVVAITSLLQQVWLRSLTLAGVLLAAAWGWRWFGTGGNDLVVLLLAVVSVISLVLLLERRHEQLVAHQRDTGERHRRSADLLTAVTRLSGDSSLVATGITRALAGAGFQEVLVAREVDGRLQFPATAGARPATGPPPAPLRRLLELTLRTGQQVSATVPGHRPADGGHPTPPRHALIVPIPGTGGPRGVLCGLAAQQVRPGIAAERWARTFASHLGTLWRREEALELEHAHLIAAARLQQTRSAFLRSVSDELTPGAMAVGARSREVLAACEAMEPPVVLSRLDHEVTALRGAVDVLLLLADIGRHTDADGRSHGDASLSELVDELARQGVDLAVDPRLRGRRLPAIPQLLARALVLWLRATAGRDAGHLEAQRLDQQLVLRAPATGPSGDSAATPAHGPMLEQLLHAAGADGVDDAAVRLPLAPITYLEQR